MSVWDNQKWNEFFDLREARRLGRGNGNRKPEMFFGGNMYFNMDGHNEIFDQWVPKVTAALKQSARWFSDGKDESMVTRGTTTGFVRSEGKLADSIKPIVRKEYGAVDAVTFNFERHGVFVHKGVGRGYRAGGNGFVVRISKNEQKKQRVAVEWFNPVLDRHMPELADRLAEINADIVINADRAHIK
jgi:hypothetical protein